MDTRRVQEEERAREKGWEERWRGKGKREREREWADATIPEHSSGTPLIKRTPFGPRPISRGPAFRDSTWRKVDLTIPPSTPKDDVDD